MTKKTFLDAKCYYCEKRNKVIYVGSMDVGKESHCLDFICSKCGKESRIWIQIWVDKIPEKKKNEN